MNEIQKIKIQTFLSDKELVNAVKTSFELTFRNKKSEEIHFLAAKSLALDFLADAFVDLDEYAITKPQETKETETNIGL